MLQRLTNAMIGYYSGDPARIQHFLKVHSFCRYLGRAEGLDQETQFTLEAAALVHDIGIKPAEAIYGSSAGKYQEELGPAEAEGMLRSLGFPQKVINRVSYLVGHHHTYTDIDGIDYQLLVEADFLVNLYEENASRESIQNALNTVFKTKSGKLIGRVMFGV